MSYDIKIPQFEGPFDLLLFFVERDELDIHDISITKITDDFLAYIKQMQYMNIELASEFILMAATLMRIKAKMLLPRPELDAEGNEIDLRKDLIQKLIEYKKYKAVLAEFYQLEEERLMQEKRGHIAFELKQIVEKSTTGDELESVDLYKLMLVFDKVMRKFQNQSIDVVHTIQQYPYTIEEQKEYIIGILSSNKKLEFVALLELSVNRVHLVYNFLAILELLQQQYININVGIGYNNFWLSIKKTS